MPSLKPVDHQNIVLRLLARSAACDAQHLATLAHAYKLSVSLHQVRVACDELVEQRFVARTPYGYRLTTYGERDLPALPLLESYCMASSSHNDGGAIETLNVTKFTKEQICRMFDIPSHLMKHVVDRAFTEDEVVELRARLERGDGS